MTSTGTEGNINGEQIEIFEPSSLEKELAKFNSQGDQISRIRDSLNTKLQEARDNMDPNEKKKKEEEKIKLESTQEISTIPSIIESSLENALKIESAINDRVKERLNLSESNKKSDKHFKGTFNEGVVDLGVPEDYDYDPLDDAGYNEEMSNGNYTNDDDDDYMDEEYMDDDDYVDDDEYYDDDDYMDDDEYEDEDEYYDDEEYEGGDFDYDETYQEQDEEDYEDEESLEEKRKKVYRKKKIQSAKQKAAARKRTGKKMKISKSAAKKRAKLAAKTSKKRYGESLEFPKKISFKEAINNYKKELTNLKKKVVFLESHKKSLNEANVQLTKRNKASYQIIQDFIGSYEKQAKERLINEAIEKNPKLICVQPILESTKSLVELKKMLSKQINESDNNIESKSNDVAKKIKKTQKLNESSKPKKLDDVNIFQAIVTQNDTWK